MEITNELANAILQYLATRPYAEVFQLIQGIQAAAKPLVVDKEPINPKEEVEDESD